ncbi:hypothetical protein GDO81_021922 [Engystomops pustulosus]|uniref:Uncharacterized protein n=1 Tax=Engystomops pustulosus TaxID=76066 RepID=A0AAV6ZNV0_ENGPU|nr:hypothetical protein GDO81_021922 [Engystomops pustulosus]
MCGVLLPYYPLDIYFQNLPMCCFCFPFCSRYRPRYYHVAIVACQPCNSGDSLYLYHCLCRFMCRLLLVSGSSSITKLSANFRLIKMFLYIRWIFPHLYYP